jgi:penicillin-insensitive murein endopeptidase
MAHRKLSMLIGIAVVVLLLGPAPAQDIGTVGRKPLAPLANPNDPNLAAKELFGRKDNPVPLAARAIGFYSRGCLAGAKALPINGQTWQVMRLSRNRNWGHPELIDMLEKLAAKVPSIAGWPGLLVGDMSQPRGGPMLTGHASHQVGLDADVWLTPMPNRTLTEQERAEMSAVMMVAPDRKDVDPKVWTRGHTAVIRAAAEDPRVERILVNAAIKKAMCRETQGQNRLWMSKVRPYWQHDYHFHIRIKCPAGSAGCEAQAPVTGGDGCGKELDWWFTDAVLHPKPPKVPPKPKPPMTLAQLPDACQQIVKMP